MTHSLRTTVERDALALHRVATAVPVDLFTRFSSTPNGVTESQAAERLLSHGENKVETGPALSRLRPALASPFVGLLAGLGVVFALLADVRGAITVSFMVALAVGLRWWQQARSDHAVSGLRGLVTTTTTVSRRATAGELPMWREVPTSDVVPGDVVRLAPGDLVPADVRILSSTGLLVDQSALSGEALPVGKEKSDVARAGRERWRGPATDLRSMCFAGTSVVGGSATGLVVATGAAVQFGDLLQAAVRRTVGGVDRGVRAVGWMLVRFMFVLVPIVLVINGTVSGNWPQALLFAVAVAVGLTPEMLPVIVTTNLARGALLLSQKKVIVKRLDAIQDLGAMDVLCVDKTGTLTEDGVTYETTKAAIADLVSHGVTVIILTGDSVAAALEIGRQVGLDESAVFARLSPAEKAEIVEAAKAGGHTVGFLGDGVNDIAALRTADVGIAVRNGMEAAKDAADLVLLRRDLRVLVDGVREGRRTLGNTLKYVYATASSNLGNVLSLVLASAFLPFLPMLPIQLMIQNLLYDAAQLALPWDQVDPDYLRRPRRWDAPALARFMLVFGPLSSLFDIAVFAVLAWAFQIHTAAVFQAGWFIEGLASQLLVVLLFRSRRFLTRPSGYVLVATSAALLIGIALVLWFLPVAYFGWLVAILVAYAGAVLAVKAAYLRLFPSWM